jgi:hypothetical protein
MMNTTALFKTDATRPIDRVIDYFGGARASAVRREVWLTGHDAKPSLPAVVLEHPLAMDSRRLRGA